MPRNYLVLGEWNAICDRCGFEHKSSQLKTEWTGLKVCSCCWEPRHPSDLFQLRERNTTPPWTRPEPTDVFAAEVILAEDYSVLFAESYAGLVEES